MINGSPNLENLSPLAIQEIAEKIRKQIAEPEDAYRLMLLFCDCVKNKRELPKELLRHFEAVFLKVVNGELKTDRALGIERSNNRPYAREEDGALIAHKLLQLRLKGKTYEKAVDLISAENQVCTTKVKNSWRKYKEQALITERISRCLIKNTFSRIEREKIDKIYKGEPYYISSF